MFKRCLSSTCSIQYSNRNNDTIDWFVGIKVWGPCRLDKWFYCLIPEIDPAAFLKKLHLDSILFRFILETKSNWNIFLFLLLFQLVRAAKTNVGACFFWWRYYCTFTTDRNPKYAQNCLLEKLTESWVF